MEDRAGRKGQGDGGFYPIGALAQLVGVSTRTLRYYEEIGLLQSARRYAGGRRMFDGDALQRLRFIGRLKNLGFSLEEISRLNQVHKLHQSTGEMLGELEGLLESHLQTLAARVAELQALRGELEDYRGRIQRRRAELA